MSERVFDYPDYKAYVQSRVGGYRERRGHRSLLAKAMGCQPTFVTQVLNGGFHFSLEQAERLNRFFEHDDSEGDFFFLLLQKERAGTSELVAHFQAKIEKAQAERKQLTGRLGEETALSPTQRETYYSSWHFAAIHVAVDIPELKTKESLATYYRLPVRKVAEALGYLCECGLVVNEGGQYSIGQARVRLGNNSPLIDRHLLNWRLQAAEALNRDKELDLHYSGVLCLSAAARDLIKSKIFDMLQEHLAISDAASSEEVCCYNIDFFSLQR